MPEAQEPTGGRVHPFVQAPTERGAPGPDVVWQRKSGSRKPRILLIDPDPYLIFLVRSEFPQARVLSAEEAQLLEVCPERVDVAVVDLESPGASTFLAGHPGVPIVGLADAPRAAASLSTGAVQGLVCRPFAASELHDAIHGALGERRPRPSLADPARWQEPGKRRDKHQVEVWLLAARLTTALLGVALELGSHHLPPIGLAAVVGALLYVASTSIAWRHTMSWAPLDLAIATVALAFTGGIASPFTPFGVVAGATTAYALGSWIGSLAGFLPAGAASLWSGLTGHGAHSAQVALWFGFFPLASLIGTVLARAEVAGGRGSELANETHRALSSLMRVARLAPGGFDLQAVTAAALEEVREALRCPGGILLLREAEIVRVAASFGTPNSPGSALGEADLPGSLFAAGQQVLPAGAWIVPGSLASGGHPCWVSSPLRSNGRTIGTLLAAWHNHKPPAETLRALEQVAADATLAVENARMYARVQELSACAERKRLGGELHDGLAQALVHIRLELDALACAGPQDQEALREDVGRLARIAERALFDVRTTILDLRKPLDEGLTTAFCSYLRDLRGLGGPDLQFSSTGNARYSPRLEAQVFRIGQEAVSNALRHAAATTLLVRLDLDASRLVLRVRDDGVGIQAPAQAAASTGVGLHSMRERARSLGARLAVSPVEGGGTCVELVVEPKRAGEPFDAMLVPDEVTA